MSTLPNSASSSIRPRSSHNDHVEGITVDQIKRLMLCFARRPPKAFFSRYNSSMASFSKSSRGKSFARISAEPQNKNNNNHIFEGIPVHQSEPKKKASKNKNNTRNKKVGSGIEKLSDDDDDESDDDEDEGENGDNENDTRGSALVSDNDAEILNVKLKPLNRAVFIERVRQVLPDRPDSVINSWFNQLDSDGLGLVTWSSFSAFLLFRSTMVDAADAKNAEFHITADAPEHPPTLILRHSAPATCMLFNPRSSDLLTGGPDGQVLAWDPSTLEPKGAILTVRSYITGMSHLDNGNRIAISAMDRSVTILDSRTMRVIRCFAGRSIPKYLEAKEVSKIIEFFEKRPDWIKIERGPRILTAPPELPVMVVPASILNSIDAIGSKQQQQQQLLRSTSPSSTSTSNQRKGSPTTLCGGRSIVAGSGAHQRHSDRPWAVAPTSHHSSAGAQHSSHEGSSTSSSTNFSGPLNEDDATALGTYLVGEAALARADAGRRTEIHVLLDLDKAPTCMCSYNMSSSSSDDNKGQVNSTIPHGAAIESHQALQTDPVILGMPDGVIKQYNLPTMFPRAVAPRATWKPHSDRVQMIRYVAEVGGVISCSDDGTFVLSHPERRVASATTGQLSSILRSYKVPSSHNGGGIVQSYVPPGSANNNTINSSSFGSLHGFAAPTRLSMAQQMKMSLGQAGNHVPAVLSFDFSPELKLLACCAYDRHAYLFDPMQDTYVAKLTGLSAPAVAVAFNAPDNQVVVSCADRTIRIYDTRHSDLPLQTLERPPFQQFGTFSSNCLTIHDRHIYTAGAFPVSYCSRSQFSETVQKNAPPTGNKLGGASGNAVSKKEDGGKLSKSQLGEMSELRKKSNAARAAYFERMAKKRKQNVGTQAFHAVPVTMVYIDELGVSSGTTRMFTLCAQQLICWSLLVGESLFNLSLPSTASGRNQNSATCSCTSEGCLKLVVGYDDGSVVLWIPAVGEAAARLPDHETIHSRVRCVGICYRRSFAVKQMIILASIENQILFLAQGEPYSLSVKASWQCPAEYGHVTCVHEIGTSNSVLCGTQSGALVILSLTTNEQEGSGLYPEMKVPVANYDHSNNNNDTSAAPPPTLPTITYEQNEFGRVESVVHTPSFGANVFAAIHTHGDVVFWDVVHRIQVGALCIRGVQSTVINTVVKDYGHFQLIAYTDELGNLYLRRLDYSMTGMNNIPGAGLIGGHGSGGRGGATASGDQGENSLNFSFRGGDDSASHQVKREPLDPYMATNINATSASNHCLVVPGGSHQHLGSIASAAPACNIVAIYKTPYDGFRSLTETEKRIKDKEEQEQFGSMMSNVGNSASIGGVGGMLGRRKSAIALELEDESGDDENSGGRNLIDPSHNNNNNNRGGGTGSNNKRRGSIGGAGRKSQHIHESATSLPPEYVNVVLSNITVAEVRTYCFEINEGLVSLVGMGGTQQWLAPPNIDEMTSCVDTEEWKLTMEQSVNFGFLGSTANSIANVTSSHSNNHNNNIGIEETENNQNQNQSQQQHLQQLASTTTTQSVGESQQSATAAPTPVKPSNKMANSLRHNTRVSVAPQNQQPEPGKFVFPVDENNTQNETDESSQEKNTKKKVIKERDENEDPFASSQVNENDNDDDEDEDEDQMQLQIQVPVLVVPNNNNSSGDQSGMNPPSLPNFTVAQPLQQESSLTIQGQQQYQIKRRVSFAEHPHQESTSSPSANTNTNQQYDSHKNNNPNSNHGSPSSTHSSPSNHNANHQPKKKTHTEMIEEVMSDSTTRKLIEHREREKKEAEKQQQQPQQQMNHNNQNQNQNSKQRPKSTSIVAAAKLALNSAREQKTVQNGVFVPKPPNSARLPQTSSSSLHSNTTDKNIANQVVSAFFNLRFKNSVFETQSIGNNSYGQIHHNDGDQKNKEQHGSSEFPDNTEFGNNNNDNYSSDDDSNNSNHHFSSGDETNNNSSGAESSGNEENSNNNNNNNKNKQKRKRKRKSKHLDENSNNAKNKPLSLVIPKGHNDRQKKADRLKHMVKAGALEEIRLKQQQHQQRNNNNLEDDENETLLMMQTLGATSSGGLLGGALSRIGGGTIGNMNSWKMLRNAQQAVSGMMMTTPRTPGLLYNDFGPTTPAHNNILHNNNNNNNNFLSASGVNNNNFSISSPASPSSPLAQHHKNIFDQSSQQGGDSKLLSVPRKNLLGGRQYQPALTSRNASRLGGESNNNNNNFSNQPSPSSSRQQLQRQTNSSIPPLVLSPESGVSSSSQNQNEQPSTPQKQQQQSQQGKQANPVLLSSTLLLAPIQDDFTLNATTPSRRATNATSSALAVQQEFGSRLPSRKASTMSTVSHSALESPTTTASKNNDGDNQPHPGLSLFSEVRQQESGGGFETPASSHDTPSLRAKANNLQEASLLLQVQNTNNVVTPLITPAASPALTGRNMKKSSNALANQNQLQVIGLHSPISNELVTLTLPTAASASQPQQQQHQHNSLERHDKNEKDTNDNSNNNATDKTEKEGEGDDESEQEKLKKQKSQNLYALAFEKSASQDEVAHRHIEAMKNRFKGYSSEVQTLVERNVRKNLEAFEAGRNPSGNVGTDGRPSKARPGGEAKDLIIYQDDKKKRLNPEQLDGYENADVLLSVLRVKERLSMQRAMGVAGKMSIFGVLTPSHDLQEKWKSQDHTEELSRIVQRAESGMIIPTRAEAGAAFAPTVGGGGANSSVHLTQMRGRKIPKLEDESTSVGMNSEGIVAEGISGDNGN